MKLNKQIIEIEKQFNVDILYCTYSGSKLYGTNDENSDTDIKFIFKPRKIDVLLKKDIEYISVTPQTNSKNTKDDIDFDGYSIYKFFNLLQKMETGAVDILFSMFRTDTIIYEDTYFTDKLRDDYMFIINKQMKSFIGYALSQSKRFGIKGDRYNELDDFVNGMKTYIENIKSNKLKDYWIDLTTLINSKDYKYIKSIKAPGPRGSGDYKEINYISVLGRLYLEEVTFEYFFNKIIESYNQFGNRTKTIANTKSKTDFKALSHAYRIASEVKELLKTNKIVFPLIESGLIKDIKYNRIEVEDAINLVETTLSEVNLLLETSNLQNNSNKTYIDNLILELIA